MEYRLLKIRTKIKDIKTVENVCKYQKTQFVTEFSNYNRRCADPLRSHKNVVKTSLHEKTLEEFRLYCVPYEILPEKNYVFVVKMKYLLRKKKLRM